MKKVGRIVISDPKKYGITDCNKGNCKDYIFDEQALCKAFARDFNENKRVEYLVTPAGLLKFDFPAKYQDYSFRDVNNNNYATVLKDLVDEAKLKVQSFIECINKSKNNIFNYTDFLVIGIDGKNNKGVQIELAFVINKKGEILHWTGKSYPIPDQENRLIRVQNYQSHIFTNGNDNVFIMVCHDLTIYNNRSKPTKIDRITWKKDFISQINQISSINVVLHLPHMTSSSRTWSSAWNELIKQLGISHWASGIFCCSYDCEKQSSIFKKVLEKTADNLVENFYI